MAQWKNDNMLMQESLPVEERGTYRRWKKDFEDKEASRINFRKEQLTKATASKIEDSLFKELAVIETVASDTSSGGDIDYKGVEDLVHVIVGGYPIPTIIGRWSYICELSGPDCQVNFAYIPEGDSNYSKYAIKDNFKHFKENAPIYIIVHLDTKLKANRIEGDPRKFFSKNGYSLLANVLNKGLISVPENGEELLAKFSYVQRNTYIFKTDFATVTDEASLTKISNAIEELWGTLYDDWARKNDL